MQQHDRRDDDDQRARIEPLGHVARDDLQGPADALDDRPHGLAEAFARVQTLGQLRAHASAETAALTLHICLSGVLYSAMLEPELFDLQRDAAEVLDVALAAYVRDGVLAPAA